MRALIMTAAILLAALAITSCAPAFNWREAPIPATPLSALFPCKPERTTRKVTLGGADVDLHMQHCETAGITAAVGHAAVRDPSLTGPMLLQWRLATLASMQVTRTSPWLWTMPGATPLPQAQALEASGSDARGQPLVLRAAWFAHGGEVYGALLYGPGLGPDVVDAFFSGLRLR